MDSSFIVERCREILARSGRVGLIDSELQELLGLSRPTLQKKRDAGLLPFCRQGGKFLYLPSHILEYLKNIDRSDRALAARRSR